MALSNHQLQYCQDAMVLYPSKSQDRQLRAMSYFITDENATKGRDPDINIIGGIHWIKGKTSVNVLVSNYTNKHIMFNKGEYIGHLEPTILDNMTNDQPDAFSN